MRPDPSLLIGKVCAAIHAGPGAFKDAPAWGTGRKKTALVAQGSTGISINRDETLSHERICKSGPLPNNAATSEIATLSSVAYLNASLWVLACKFKRKARFGPPP